MASDNVIGPITSEDWILLRQLRETVKHYLIYGDNRHKPAIDIYKNCYSYTINKYLINRD